VVGTHIKKEKWRRQALERRRPTDPTKTRPESAWLLVAVSPRMGKTWELQQAQAAQPGRKECGRREKNPSKSGVRPKGQSCLNKRRRRPQG